jgi:imidazolonepropionase-like amidohydrolase
MDEVITAARNKDRFRDKCVSTQAGSERRPRKDGEGRGVKVVISTDTHVLSQYEYMIYGVSIARRGWLEKRDVLNTMSCNGLLKALKK